MSPRLTAATTINSLLAADAANVASISARLTRSSSVSALDASLKCWSAMDAMPDASPDCAAMSAAAVRPRCAASPAAVASRTSSVSSNAKARATAPSREPATVATCGP
jgi:hypothetical protein